MSRKRSNGKISPMQPPPYEESDQGSSERKKSGRRFASPERSRSPPTEKGQTGGLQKIINLKTNATKWRQYACTRRQRTSKVNPSIGLDYSIESSGTDEALQMKNRNLIEYFSRLGKASAGEHDRDTHDAHDRDTHDAHDACDTHDAHDACDTVDLALVEQLLKEGADVNCADRFGQTVFHEVARTWHVDVASFLLSHGADVNKADKFHRTPLHVAAASDYKEMVALLIENHADREARTKGELQTPVHFAARNDAFNALEQLVRMGCNYKTVRDYKKRTPLHVAVELDRSETAEFLLNLKDPPSVGVTDSSGQSALGWMVTKMPPVALLAFDHLYIKDKANRKQHFHLEMLEPQKPHEEGRDYAQTVLEMTAKYHRYDLIEHPVVERIIRLKWEHFGRFRACWSTVKNLLFILLWSVQGVLVDFADRHVYSGKNDWWRIFLFCLALIMTGEQIFEELRDFFRSKRSHKEWRDWRQDEIKKDLKYAHPRWPEEEKYLRQELKEAGKQDPSYFDEQWNIFDWVCYALLLASTLTHVGDILRHSVDLARWHIRCMTVTVILLWLRLLKNARAFSTLGPFIVMLSHMMGDIVKFILLYTSFLIPYSCAFWMMFGASKVAYKSSSTKGSNATYVEVDGFHNPGSLVFSLFRLTLVDDYDYDSMKAIDPIMANILVGTWLAFSAILMLNLLIALLSDTFQRVYDNAKANAIMQKLITIQSIEEKLSKRKLEEFRKCIHEECAPLSEYYDDDELSDTANDLKKGVLTVQDRLEELMGEWDEWKSRNTSQHPRDHPRTSDYDVINPSHFHNIESEVSSLKSEIDRLIESQKLCMQRMKRETADIKELLKNESSTNRSRRRKNLQNQREIQDDVDRDVSGHVTSSRPATRDARVYSRNSLDQLEDNLLGSLPIRVPRLEDDQDWQEEDEKRKQLMIKLQKDIDKNSNRPR